VHRDKLNLFKASVISRPRNKFHLKRLILLYFFFKYYLGNPIKKMRYSELVIIRRVIRNAYRILIVNLKGKRIKLR